VPLTLCVFVSPSIFDLFQVKETKTRNYFEEKKASKFETPLAEAAFGLFQWAEYGDVYEFETPEKESEVDQETTSDEDDEESTEQGRQLDQSINASKTNLPCTDEPSGLQVTLRAYQKQALWWMLQRETSGESRIELEQQLELLAELAGTKLQSQPTCDVQCECGPVLVSPAAREETRTLDGQVNPLVHPLWKQRFLASHDLSETRCFYVNELLGTARHTSPTPPTPCSGGILADAMGLGEFFSLNSNHLSPLPAF
jgi:SNF2 family DNA or RNA helicase